MKEITCDEVLKHSGLKRTEKRILVYRFLETEPYPVTAETIHKALASSMDLSTVYRILAVFETKGFLKKEVDEKKQNVFFLRKEDRHVLVCTSCHKRIPLTGCPYHEVNEKIEKDTGFLVKDQNTEIFGLCPECRKKQKENRGC